MVSADTALMAIHIADFKDPCQSAVSKANSTPASLTIKIH